MLLRNLAVGRRMACQALSMQRPTSPSVTQATAQDKTRKASLQSSSPTHSWTRVTGCMMCGRDQQQGQGSLKSMAERNQVLGQRGSPHQAWSRRGACMQSAAGALQQLWVPLDEMGCSGPSQVGPRPRGSDWSVVHGRCTSITYQ